MKMKKCDLSIFVVGCLTWLLFYDSPEKFFSSLLTPTFIVYSLALMIIYLVSRLQVIKNNDLGSKKNYFPNRLINMFLVLFSIVAVSPWFGLYQLYFPQIYNSFDFFSFLVRIVLVGGILFIILFEVINRLSKIDLIDIQRQRIVFKISNKSKYFIIVALILVISAGFSFQSFQSLNYLFQHNPLYKPGYEMIFNTYSDTGFALSNDFTKIAYITTHGGEQDINGYNGHFYLVVRDLQTNKSDSYDMCNFQSGCLDLSLGGLLGLYFYNSSTLLIFNANTNEYIFNLNSGKFSKVYFNSNVQIGFEDQFKCINSTVYFGSINLIANVTHLTLENSVTMFNYTINLPSLPDVYYYTDYAISPNLTHLALLVYNEVYYYTVHKQNNQFNATFENKEILQPQSNSNVAQTIISWSNDLTNLYYTSHDNEYTYLYLYNNTNHVNTLLSKILGVKSISFVNIQEQFFITGYHWNSLNIYSFKSNNTVLLQNTSSFYLTTLENQNKFLSYNFPNLSLISFDPISNVIIQSMILDTFNNPIYINISPTEANFIKTIYYSMSLISISVFTISILSVGSDVYSSLHENKIQSEKKQEE